MKPMPHLNPATASGGENSFFAFLEMLENKKQFDARAKEYKKIREEAEDAAKEANSRIAKLNNGLKDLEKREEAVVNAETKVARELKSAANERQGLLDREATARSIEDELTAKRAELGTLGRQQKADVIAAKGRATAAEKKAEKAIAAMAEMETDQQKALKAANDMKAKYEAKVAEAKRLWGK